MIQLKRYGSLFHGEQSAGYACTLCGAAMMPDEREVHRAWHALLSSLVRGEPPKNPPEWVTPSPGERLHDSQVARFWNSITGKFIHAMVKTDLPSDESSTTSIRLPLGGD